MDNLPVKTEDPQRFYLMEHKRRNIRLSKLNNLSTSAWILSGISLIGLIITGIISSGIGYFFLPLFIMSLIVGGIGSIVAGVTKSNRSSKWKSDFSRQLLPELLQAQFPDYDCKTYRNITKSFIKKLQKWNVDKSGISGIAYFSVSGRVQELDIFIAKIGIFQSNGHTSVFSGNIILVNGKDFRENFQGQVERSIKRIKKELEQGFNTTVSFHISSHDLCYFLISPSRIELQPKDNESLFSAQYFEHNYEKIKVLVSIAEKMAEELA